jgi:hypothetical protein
MDNKNNNTIPALAKITDALIKKNTMVTAGAIHNTVTTVPSIVIDGVKQPLLNEPNIKFQSKLNRENWRTVIDVAKKNRDLSDNKATVSRHHNEMFVNDKFNWIFFSIIMSILVIFSIIICFSVYYFIPQFRF